MGNHIDGVYLKKQIKQAGYTLDEFYKELGIAKTTFYYYRIGARPIPHKLRQRIEELLQCPFQKFLKPEQESTLMLLPLEQPQPAHQCFIPMPAPAERSHLL
ncbi:hypothetical protein KDA_76030 [Dictyobacter alpinus]|uniref:HTH cro/C1-type domain-containing protein n=1 Tax=Dictyobacter alpinus TaxID=2014873 RepID=A0A402BLB7_9CHLR|nr:helix-turn-helix transcriptional regulator [Dictyobacter alpinus]GCE32119.1 hypothetical protein KDA_76030 [Dictyobacter alpinus]